jgi:hypothetical protein
MRLDLLARQLKAQEKASRTSARRNSKRLQAAISEAERAIGVQIRALEADVLWRPGSSPMRSKHGSTS